MGNPRHAISPQHTRPVCAAAATTTPPSLSCVLSTDAVFRQHMRVGCRKVTDVRTASGRFFRPLAPVQNNFEGASHFASLQASLEVNTGQRRLTRPAERSYHRINRAVKISPACRDVPVSQHDGGHKGRVRRVRSARRMERPHAEGCVSLSLAECRVSCTHPQDAEGRGPCQVHGNIG